MYHEDVDLFWRMRLAGYGLELLPAAVIWHKYHFSKNTGKFFYVQRNRLFFILRCYGWRTMLLVLPFALVTEFLMLLFSLKGGWVVGKIKADLQAVFRLPLLLAERRGIQATRKLTDKQLSVWFSDTLNFGAVSIPGVALFNGCSRLYWKVVSALI
jgi:GT2 family glycosyltransferase